MYLAEAKYSMFSFCVFLFFSLLSYIFFPFSAAWPYLDPLSIFRPVLRLTLLSKSVSIGACWIKHPLIFQLTSPVIPKRDRPEMIHQKNLSMNTIKSAAWGNMHLYLDICVHILYQWQTTRLEADNFALDYWTSFIVSYFSKENTVWQAKVLEVTDLLSKAFLHATATLSLYYLILMFSPFQYYCFL